MRKNKGITLIALIITIIIMLILVAVSVNILIKSNLIGIAEKATDKYKTASEEEAKGGSITINGKKYESIDEYINDINGAAPKLKYVQEGSQIYVYLKGSYYDYIALKKLDEKEQLYAEKLGEASIEEVIKNDFNNSREEYEKTIQEKTEFSYELGLNSILVQERIISDEEYGLYYTENVLKLKTDEEKEKELIKLNKKIYGMDGNIEEMREILKKEAEEMKVSYTDILSFYIFDVHINEFCDLWDGENLRVRVMLPNGGESIIAYTERFANDGTEYISEFNIAETNTDYISENNTIKFTAEDYKGRTSELLVPANAKTFKIKISDTDIRTYKFIDGQTWEHFIGSSKEIKTSDGSIFLTYDTGEIGLKINESTLTNSKLNVKNSTKIASLDKTKIKMAEIHYKVYYICIRNGESLVRVKLEDKIIPNTVYELEELVPKPQGPR